MSDAPFRPLNAKTVFRNPWIRLEEYELEAVESGHRFTYTYLSSRPSVMIVALTADREIVLIRQYRFPTRRFSWELPGGGTGDGEPGEAARRELAEETGFQAGRVERLGEFVVYCGLADEICHVFLATQLELGRQKLEKSESIEATTVSFERLDEMIAEGEFCDGMGLAALGVARRRLGW